MTQRAATTKLSPAVTPKPTKEAVRQMVLADQAAALTGLIVVWKDSDIDPKRCRWLPEK